ncbi:MAG: glucokinase [Burkholderiales bacterium]
MTGASSVSSSATPYPRLLADVGGTNARFAWVTGPQTGVSHVRVLPCADHAALADAVRHYLAIESLPAPAAMAMGIATAITGDAVRMTNHHWAFSIRELQAALGLVRLVVLNDFTALALALPSLTAAELRQVGGGSPRPGQPIALIGPGTGLGVSGLLPGPAGSWVPIAGEGGHATLPASSAREAVVIGVLRSRFGHVSAERVLSGAGLVALYEVLCQLEGSTTRVLTPAEVSAHGLAGSDAHCVEALELFCALLGTMAGNHALTLGAFGGVYIGGGIVPRLGGFFDRSAFRARFEAKGRYAEYLGAIPVFVIDTAVSPALAGAALALDQA